MAIQTPTIIVLCDQCDEHLKLMLSRGSITGGWYEGDLAERIRSYGWEIGARGEHRCIRCVKSGLHVVTLSQAANS